MSTPMSSQRRTASRIWRYCGECCGCSCTPMRIGKLTRLTYPYPSDANLAVRSPHRNHRRACRSVAAFGPPRQRSVDAVLVALPGMLHAHGDQVVGDNRTARLGAKRHGEELLGLATIGAVERHREQSVVRVQGVAVRRDPQIAVA